ncbi:uncharacterized protein LOC112638313 [Camponotus floridanus]|uniref:uncharacterized protein LOC112638313 n=1 Tax=Camponotus floridanus TaxID=104421 RepID=UPI000DC68382|nr:uncharacterized protein LOC112638313 [Camponotus floridanus]
MGRGYSSTEHHRQKQSPGTSSRTGGSAHQPELRRTRAANSKLNFSRTRLTGTKHIRTTAYHPEANGMVERFHRQLKAAIKCYETEAWTQVLPVVLLGIRAVWKEDVNSTPTEMLYGEPIRLPGQFLDSSNSLRQGEEDTLVTRLRKAMIRLQPTVKHHARKTTFVFKDMETASHVFVRHDAPAGALHLPYDGPFEVLN